MPKDGITLSILDDDHVSSDDAPIPTPGGTVFGPNLAIFDPGDVQRQIDKLSPPRGAFEMPEEAAGQQENHLPSEDRLRLSILRQILAHPLGSERPLIFGSTNMTDRILATKESAPHFGEFVDLIARAVTLSIVTMTPLRLPPILLLGSPGIGKTYMTKRLAKALESDVCEIALNIIDAFRLRGLNSSWKSARIGRIADALLQSKTASPVILIDEFDKPAWINSYENPHDIFHSLLEEENAKAFVDDYLEFPLRADKIIWIASANDISKLAPSIVDRLLVLNIPDPSSEHLAVIIDNIYTITNARYRDAFVPQIQSDVRGHLIEHNPRRISRLLDLSFARAAADHRLALRLSDVILSESLLAGESSRVPLGFLTR